MALLLNISRRDRLYSHQYTPPFHHDYEITDQEVADYWTELNIKREGKYAGLDYEVALQKYVYEEWLPGVKVMKDGKRYLIGPDIKTYHDKSEGRGAIASWGTKPCEEFYSPPGPLHVLEYHDSRVRLDIIDHISEEIYAAREAIGIHPSEREWALPRSHPRHLLNFPREIFDKILGCTLIVNDDVGTLFPQVITSNISRVYHEAGYRIARQDYIGRHQDNTLSLELVHGLRNETLKLGSHKMKKLEISDEDGTYTQLQRVLHRVIDASCLRVCKSFYCEGSEMLYGQNDFTFDLITFMSQTKCRRISDSSLMLDRQGPRQDLDGIIPILRPGYKSYKQWLNHVKEVITEVQQPVPLRALRSWAHQDPFLRFLFVIRPQNAALIKTLQFWGKLSRHDYVGRAETCGFRQYNFFRSIYTYIQFINKFCKGLQTIKLYIDRGNFRHLGEEDILAPLIGHLKKLKTVKTLVLCSVVKTDEWKFLPMKSPLAVEICQWFEDRARGCVSKYQQT